MSLVLLNWLPFDEPLGFFLLFSICKENKNSTQIKQRNIGFLIHKSISGDLRVSVLQLSCFAHLY